MCRSYHVPFFHEPAPCAILAPLSNYRKLIASVSFAASLVELGVSQAVGYSAVTRKVEMVGALDLGRTPAITTLEIVGQPSVKSVYAAGHELQASEIAAVHCYLLIRA
jgi:hypothetical protein